PLRDRCARRAHPAQSADRAALARADAERRQPRADRVRAQRGQRRGPDLRARRDGRCRVRGVRRPRSRRRAEPPQPAARRRRALGAARLMNVTGAWLCLFPPIAGAVLITLGGTRLPRVAAGWISTVSVFTAFGGAVWSF